MKMKKTLLLLFVIACLLLCAVPSVGMIFHPTTERIGNEPETPLPSITAEDGSFNSAFLPQTGTYFDKHFAFRPQSITADAMIQSRVFKTSDLDTVTVGSNGWLYYSSTLDDFLGRNTLSQKEINGILHNLTLVQETVVKKGAKFLFTIAPNKNTLYPENMPYYYQKAASETRNRDLFEKAVTDSGLNYCDLFTLFKGQDEILYLKEDSHWNDKGALLAYNAILDTVGKEHNDYSGAEVTRSRDFYGDLAKMLYPAGQQPEYNYHYDIVPTYSYLTPTKSVEDAVIKTENPAASGSLYMYRDSFGNALLPFFANAYGNAHFTKAYPINLDLDMLTGKSDTVIFEIVERNLSWFLNDPPVMQAPERALSVSAGEQGRGDVQSKLSEVNMQYIAVSGSVDSKLCDDDSAVYLKISGSDGRERIYEAYSGASKDGNDRFLAYIPASLYADQPLEVDVLVGKNTEATQVYHASLEPVSTGVTQ